MKEFDKIVDSLTPKMRKIIWDDILAVERRLARRLPGDFWNDETRAENTKQKMKDSWAKRKKPEFEVSQRTTGAIFKCVAYEEVADLTGYAVASVKSMISTGKGSATFYDADEVYEAVKL